LLLGPPDTETLTTLFAGVTVPVPELPLEEPTVSLPPPQETMLSESAMPKQPAKHPRSAIRK
jgi:hypothetical protein